MHRLMHVTHISSVLVQKVSVFGSSRTSKVFHLTAEEHTDVFRYPRTQPTTSTCRHICRPSQVKYKPVAIGLGSGLITNPLSTDTMYVCCFCNHFNHFMAEITNTYIPP